MTFQLLFSIYINEICVCFSLILLYSFVCICPIHVVCMCVHVLDVRKNA